MRIREVDSQVERRIVQSLIMSDAFLGQSMALCDVRLLKSPHHRTIAKWCQQYYAKFKKAPQQHIENRFHSWSESGRPREEEIDAVQDILSYLSDQYETGEPINVPYMMDELAHHLSICRLELLKNNLEEVLITGDKDKAEQLIQTYQPIHTGINDGIDPLTDESLWEEAFSEQQEPLILFNDKAADSFFRNALVRDGLIGILGPEKRGKTWWLLEFVVRALLNRRKVAMFEVGDMSQSQVLKRLAMRTARLPLYERHVQEGVQWPVGWEWTREDGDEGKRRRVPTMETRHPKRTISARTAKMAMQRFVRRCGLSTNHPQFKVSVHANSSINVAGIEAILEGWKQRENFIPDVVAIDYPDILLPEPESSGKQTRDQINDTWKALRRLSQERHCLALCPTQADAASYLLELLTASNYSEDKRKGSHVTGMLALNQIPFEKDNQVTRLNWVLLREDDFALHKCLRVAQCLSLGQCFVRGDLD